MPELPEVETVKTAINAKVQNAKILTSQLYRDKIRFPIPSNFTALTSQNTLKTIERRSKYILLHLDNAHTIILHLGMSGRIYIEQNKKDTDRHKHDHWVCTFDNGYTLSFNDPRRFGILDITPTDNIKNHPLLKNIGPEPLGSYFTATYLYNVLQNKKAPIKTTILDQKNIAGIGNIYASEALFRSNINPQRISNSLSKKETTTLHKEIIETLNDAIKAGGSTLKDFHHTDGSLGYFQHQFKVYDKENHPCPNCTCDGTYTIKKITQAGRSTYFCPHKQK